MADIKQKLLAIIKQYKATQLILAFLIFWIPVIIFAKIAGEVVEKQPISLDIHILIWIHSISTAMLDKIFLVFTTVGNVKYILPISVAIMAYLIYKKQRHNALILLFGVGGAAVSNFILKLIFHRDRPTFWHSAITETGYSFPSGHAMISSALILCLIVMTWNTKWRLLSIIVGGVVVVMIGLSRLYMGVHYPTDVVAGWSVSIIWVFLVVTILKI